MTKLRGSGILMHISSLPSRYGIGDLGPAAYSFIEFLRAANQNYWQLLPIHPTTGFCAHSPYNALSAFAGNPLLISPELLASDGWIDEGLLPPEDISGTDSVDFNAAEQLKEKLFAAALLVLKNDKERQNELRDFSKKHKAWLEDFALFMALKKWYPNCGWNQWPLELRDRKPAALKQARQELRDEIERQKFLQFLFFQQWEGLCSFAAESQVEIIGDIPIYLFFDSADVWAHPEYFKLDDDKVPTHVSGVPPDYFSKTGQLWGNPVYNWEALEDDGFNWWVDRMRHLLTLFDCVRIDHFRGLVGYWEVVAGEKTAMNGYWVEVPADKLFTTLRNAFPTMPFIAEDLGIITDDVKEIMARFQLPGMRVLLFGFDGDPNDNPNYPDRIIENCVLYTGTHDNNTVQGWFTGEAAPSSKAALGRYLKREVAQHDIHETFIKMAVDLPAQLVVFPVQDVLGLGASCRMNNPAESQGDWLWRLRPNSLTAAVSARLALLTASRGLNVWV